MYCVRLYLSVSVWASCVLLLVLSCVIVTCRVLRAIDTTGALHAKSEENGAPPNNNKRKRSNAAAATKSSYLIYLICGSVLLHRSRFLLGRRHRDQTLGLLRVEQSAVLFGFFAFLFLFLFLFLELAEPPQKIKHPKPPKIQTAIKVHQHPKATTSRRIALRISL